MAEVTSINVVHDRPADWPSINEARAGVLEQIRDYGPSHFSMVYWFVNDRVGKPLEARQLSEIHVAQLDQLNECGAAACFAGHGKLFAVNIGVDLHVVTREFEIPERREIAALLGVPQGMFEPDALELFADEWAPIPVRAQAEFDRITAYLEAIIVRHPDESAVPFRYLVELGVIGPFEPTYNDPADDE